MALAALATVLCGIDVLERDGFRTLQGRKVALITNHTGRTRDGRHIVDVFHESPDVDLVALFAPEHGIRGEVDAPVKDGVDLTTGLTIHSLYNPRAGAGRFRPTNSQLKGVDTLVFDIQDIGTRFYTYVGTMGYAMEEAHRLGLKFVVLDRPNPIGGVWVDGPTADEDKLGLTAYHPIPLVHGMTAGEIALYFKSVKGLDGLDLEIVKCEGWKRSQTWEYTGLTWINPSPNMRTVTQAILYPGIALVEATNISVGRGTDTPFELVGAPYIDGQKLASLMSSRGLQGVLFYPIEFTPDATKFSGEKCGGIAIMVTDRAVLEPIRVGMDLAWAIHKLFPEWDETKLVRLVQNQVAADAILDGGYEKAAPTWQSSLASFKKVRAKFLIYD
ncbi:MAG: DUF1343 domain-containing protein [Armatimonadetes bacterium]|nr:DUF1343 domain-containing protein [Armatimonadota bacterium]